MKQLTVEGLPFWKHLTDEQRAALQSCARVVHYGAGEVIRASGRECLGLLLIQQGGIRIYLLSEEGREATLSSMGAGEVCVLSASCMLSAITFEVEIQAERDTQIQVVPVQYLSQLMQENIYVENFIYKSAAERFSDAIQAVERMLFLTLEQRLVTYLLDETAKTGVGEVHATQEQIAVAIGSAREVVTRTLKKLATAGEVELFRGGVRILDRKALYGRI